MLERTENAPVHNMEAERTLGLVDSHLRRAPNARVDLISAKVKCSKNKTIDWLNNMSDEKQRKVIKSAIKQRSSLMKQQKERKQRNMTIMNQRLYEKVQKKQKKETNQIQKKVKELFGQHKIRELTLSDVENEFPSASPTTVSLAIQICHTPASIVGKDCTHLWYDEEMCKWDLYCAGAVEYSRNKFTMEYWFPGSPEDSHEAYLTPVEIVTDLILGDLVFV